MIFKKSDADHSSGRTTFAGNIIVVNLVSRLLFPENDLPFPRNNVAVVS